MRADQPGKTRPGDLVQAGTRGDARGDGLDAGFGQVDPLDLDDFERFLEQELSEGD
jgi:hypothetical protein